MGIAKIQEHIDGQSLNCDENGVYTAKTVYKIIADNVTDDQFAIAAELSYPDASYNPTTNYINVYDPHPSRPSCRIRSVDVERVEGKVWKAVLNYSSGPLPAKTTLSSLASAISDTTPPTPSNDPSSGNSNSRPAPMRPPEVTIATREFTTIGQGYLNTIGDLLEGIEEPRSNLVITIKYFSLNMTLAGVAARRQKINDASWLGFPKGTLLVKDIQLQSKYDIVNNVGGTDIYGEVREVTVSLEYAEIPAGAPSGTNGWDFRILNAGRFYKPAAGANAGKKLPVPSASGHAGDPVPLKSNGDIATTASDFHYIYFPRYDTLDFTTLLI